MERPRPSSGTPPFPQVRSPSQHSNRLTALREFRKIYAHREERLAVAFGEDWPLHLRQFTAACEYYDVPEGDRGQFLLLSLHGGAVHSFMEVVEGLSSGKKDWQNISRSFSAWYASLTRQEEASAVLDRMRLESYRSSDGDDRAALTALFNKIECTARWRSSPIGTAS